ncbi:citramalate synthase [Heliophilum fasciatum]|uniref:Citramalate synthase n=1 Tax=Heliophilum fasciatum TaxID=35700 RepID=A0A4R2S0Z5_9FIRM|nr:citramalate synthase [Heliophilum fasciatum]MCW2277647.1 2-isopropylmalate synthase [Heliophilum fasciatum]TCP64995.1 2-isopropylmalate synthase [Heliophilum fasciatum]
MNRVFIYDTTLRDGTQGEGISLSVEDKVKIAQRLDRLGVAYIEGGWPSSNPKDMEFFRRAQKLPWKNAKIAAFGSTCRPGSMACDDPNLKAIVESGAPVATIFGKTWDFHVTTALKTTLEENLRLIHDSVTFLKESGMEVIFDAEHFYDGYAANPEYAKEAILTAEKAGADWVCLCDTNGGTLPQEILAVTQEIVFLARVPIGLHVHNDGDLAVANSLMGVMAGARQIQGTINGYGERCGNANLCSIIPNVQVKMKMDCIPGESLAHLTDTAHYIAEIANQTLRNDMPYVGRSAFAHKGGMHVSALLKDAQTYEHVTPETVGNQRRILVSELSGMSNVIYKAKELGLDISHQNPQARQIIDNIKELENQGYQFEGAEASFELMLRRAFDQEPEPFVLDAIKLMIEKRSNAEFTSEATIKLRIGDQVVHTAAEGNGPVNAVDNALRKALGTAYPFLQSCHLSDYKVRVLDEKNATGSPVRVLIETRDAHDTWSTVGVSTNIIEASWEALRDSFLYGWLQQQKKGDTDPVG